ncbi:gamma-glutamylcyclotransferase family protein [Nitrospina gracilis]|uniref:gamma-glutamylcyclotransferase family protein n=1 Tax=Nitrospina gracilis TaxID=35801 RepID=UPI001F47A2D4|nr:gamma-glutamylcyclotransferase family protein [Nitrospina gracilis]MCF8721505.1 gamma-glutamylcyclotransferase (GGCT)/AIG2-like uncharacterized protein YtfP [Nitrospina gracilis Nb-211]
MPNYINWFAYDELMNPRVFKEHGLEANASFCVTLSAHKLAFNKIPLDNQGIEKLGMANVIPAASNLGMMEGIMYEMDESFLPKLDEIYHYPDEYLRKKMRLTKHDFTLVDGIVYIAHSDRTNDALMPSKAMLKNFRECKKNLTMLYLSRLMNTPTVD